MSEQDEIDATSTLAQNMARARLTQERTDEDVAVSEPHFHAGDDMPCFGRCFEAIRVRCGGCETMLPGISSAMAAERGTAYHIAMTERIAHLKNAHPAADSGNPS